MTSLLSPRTLMVAVLSGSCFLMHAQHTGTAPSRAAEVQVVAPDDSEMTKFLARKGVVTIQTHYPVTDFQTGKGQRLRVEGLVASSGAGDATKLKALRLAGASTATLDLDEAVGLSRCLETFLVTAQQWNQTSPGARTQVSYEGHEGFEIQLLWTKTSISVSMKMNDASEARVAMDTTDLPGFKRAVDDALTLLGTK